MTYEDIFRGYVDDYTKADEAVSRLARITREDELRVPFVMLILPQGCAD